MLVDGSNPLDESARLEALHTAELLDSGADHAFDRFTRLAAAVMDVPVALVSLVDEDRQFFKSSVGLPEPWARARQTPLSHSFCQHAVTSGEPLIVEDARQHPLMKDNPAIHDLAVVAYLGVPLITSAGHALGAFCVIDSEPRQWSDREIAIVRDIAAAVMTEIELRAQTRAARREATDRKRVEDEVRRSEARLAAVVRTALDCIVGMDHAGRVTEWNPAAEQTFGYSRDEAMGQEMASLIIPPALRARHREGLSRYLATGEGHVLGRRFEIAAVRKHGSEFPVELTIIRLPGEGPPAFAGYIRDLTDQKRAAEARRMSDFRWQRLVEQSPLSTQLFAPDGTIRQVNAAWERLWGVTQADLPGYNILQDEQLVQSGLLPLFRRAFSGEAVTIEPILYTPDRGEYAGQPRWCGAYVYPVKDDAGRVEEVVLVHNDVTDQHIAEEALRESEELVRTIAENSTQGLAMMNAHGYCTYANRAWLDMTGYTSDEIGAKPLHDLVHHHYPDGRPYPMEECPIDRALPERFDVRAHEDLFFRRDGSSFPVLVAASPIFKDGRPVSTVIEIRDVTMARRAEAERERLLESERAARVEAERASRMKDEFLTTLSHELRTPLHAILGWSQILVSSRRDDETLAEGLRTIERNARAQTQIIEDLLDMSRIASGKVRLDVQQVDLGELTRLALETARPSADAKGIRLQPVLDPHAGLVSGDPNRLQQVLWNLLSNAVKFTPKGGRVQVVLERVNSHVELSVTDTGEGIRPEFLPYVFDRFRQGDATTTRRHGGLGLGLSIVKQLVELHGGSVRATSLGLGHGAKFVVALPVTVLHQEPNTAEERRHPLASSAPAGLPDKGVQMAGVKVLIVDDEPDARALVKRLLEDCGAQVSTAASAAEALDQIRTERPDVLISDVGMPGEDGYSLMRRVRALGPDDGGSVPAIAVTAYARSEDRTRSILAGFQMHISKPIEPSELIAVVATLAGRGR